MYIVPLIFLGVDIIVRFTSPGDVVGAAFGGSGTASLAANIERRSSIYIDVDKFQAKHCRPRWSHAQVKLMAEHTSTLKRMRAASYVLNLKSRRFLFPTSTTLNHVPPMQVKSSQARESAVDAKLKEMGSAVEEQAGELMKDYSKVFDTIIDDPFGFTYISSSKRTPATIPDWLKQRKQETDKEDQVL